MNITMVDRVGPCSEVTVDLLAPLLDNIFVAMRIGVTQ